MSPITLYTIVHPSPTAPPITGGFANAQTAALASAITPTPPTSWLQAVDTLITSLKTAGVWSTLDLFYCFAAPSPNACTFNWVNTAVGQLTANGTINYSTNQYAASDGSTGWFSSSFTVNSGNAVNGNAEFGHFCLNDDLTDAVCVFGSSGGYSYCSMQASSAAINTINGSLNTQAAGTWSSQWGSTAGHFVIQQQDTSSTLVAYLDGASLGTSVQTNHVDSGTVQIFKTSGTAFTSRQISFVHYGSQLTSAQQLALSQALYTFLAAMGVRPLAGEVGNTTGPTNVAPYKHIPTGNGNNLYVPSPVGTAEIQGRAGAYPYALITVNDPNYKSLWRLECHEGDQAPYDSTSGLRRIQLDSGSISFPWQTTIDLAFSFWLESGSGLGSGDSFMSFCCETHSASSSLSCGPFHALTVPGYYANAPGPGYYFVNGFTGTSGRVNQYPATSWATLATGQWHHVRTTCRFDSSPNGFLQSWFDGVQVVNFSGTYSDPSAAAFRPQMVLYMGETPTGAPPIAYWIANLQYDTSGTQPYASLINNPLPVPPLV